MRKKVLALLIIVLIGIFCGIMLSKNNKDIINTNVGNEQIIESNVMINEEVDNTNTIKNENLNEEKIENNKQENVSTETFKESPKTADEKAIEIAKKDYGDMQGIKFGIEGMDEKGRYIVTVRNSETTEALVFYFVNVDNSTFNKKEMN